MATSIRVTLRYIEILDSKDLDGEGEFVFEFKGSVPDRGVEQSVRIPDEGHLSISEHPSMRKVTFNKVIFEGEIEDGDTFVLEATGTELDTVSKHDELNPYRREFSGPVSDWEGEHGPWDEGGPGSPDPEQLGDWRIAFAIERP